MYIIVHFPTVPPCRQLLAGIGTHDWHETCYSNKRANRLLGSCWLFRAPIGSCPPTVRCYSPRQKFFAILKYSQVWEKIEDYLKLYIIVDITAFYCYNGCMSRTYETTNRSPSWWLWSEPKWWRKLNKHRKRRAELKRCLCADDWDAQVWPLDKKPWKYYW